MDNKKNNSLLLYNSSKDRLSSELYSFEKNKGFCHEKTDTKAYGRFNGKTVLITGAKGDFCLLYTSPSPRDAHESRMPSSA